MSVRQRISVAFLSNRHYQFWGLNLFGWCGYGFIVSFRGFIWKEDLVFQLFYPGFAMATGLLLSLVMRESFRRFWNLPPMSRGLVALLTVALATGLWAYIKMIASIEAMGADYEEKDRISEFFSWYTYSFFILLSWAALYFGIKYYQMLQEEKQRRLKATSMAHQAQLKMLRYQLNPHFLFNTLNAISTLVLENDTKLANGMLMELSKFLRFSLENDPMQKIDLAQEVGALQLYLNIEKVRFEDRLQVNFDIEEEAYAALVPSLLLQPLVENSIKYAVSKSEQGGTISIAARVFADELLIEIEDDGPGISLVDGKLPEFRGVGLRNFRERLKEIYGESHACKFSNAEPQGLKIHIRIPFEHRAKERTV